MKRQRSVKRFGLPTKVICQICRKEFICSPSDHQRFCSVECARANLRTRNGESQTRIYKIWISMIRRCTNPKNADYARYGGKGVEVCDEWSGSYEAFKAWALESGYAEELQIDRIDGNGNYEPSNCRWATVAEQARNRGARSDKTSSRFKGVSFRYGKWRARIRIGGKLFQLGVFDSEIEAARAYDQRALAEHGDFACLNLSTEKA